MGFQYAAKSKSSARERSALSPLRAATRIERRVSGKDSPGEVIVRLRFRGKSLRRAWRKRQEKVGLVFRKAPLALWLMQELAKLLFARLRFRCVCWRPNPDVGPETCRQF